MKTTLAIMVALCLTGCGAWDRGVASVTGIAHTCVDGVMYLQFTSGASVAYLPDGKVRTCK
jgi:hypothetical protein